MDRHALYHCGLDCKGNRHWRMKSAIAMRNARRYATLRPRMFVASQVCMGRACWRNGLQRRRWVVLAGLVRADRRSFQMTLSCAPLISPIPPRFG